MENNEEIYETNPNFLTKYDIVFIGGGPATLSFFSFLLKQKILEKFMNTLNILVIEKSNNFGSGCLGKYGINSNTSAEGFVRLIYYNSEDDKNSEEAKNQLSPTKHKGNNIDKINNDSKLIKNSKQSRVISCFRELYESYPIQSLLYYGSKPAPLSLIGHYLDCAGNSVADFILNNYGKKILMLNSEAVSITFDEEKYKSNNSNKLNYNYEITIKRNSSKISSNNKNILIKSKILILASGAKQKFDVNLNKEIFSQISQSDFYHSDYILQENGYSSLINNLNNKSNKIKKLVIIGGSHSGFSCAWLLLNGPAITSEKFTNLYRNKTNPNCHKCTTEFCCLGQTNEKKWKTLKNKINQNDFEILILYRDHIRVYYHSEKEALNDGYNLFDPKNSVNKNGNVYPFIGIRGDSKELYRKTVKGIEKRIKLIKIKNLEDQKNLIQSAHAVIWAAGYTTERIKIVGKNKKEILLNEDENLQYEVDKDLRLMFKENKENKENNSINSLLGIGQGYSTHSVEILKNGKNARADSVNLYNTYISKKLINVLENLLSNRSREKDKNSIKNNNFKSPQKSPTKLLQKTEEIIERKLMSRTSERKILKCDESKVIINQSVKSSTNENILTKKISSSNFYKPKEKENPIRTINKEISPIYNKNDLAKSSDLFTRKMSQEKIKNRNPLNNYNNNSLIKSSEIIPGYKSPLQLNKLNMSFSKLDSIIAVNMSVSQIKNNLNVSKNSNIEKDYSTSRRNKDFDIFIPHPSNLAKNINLNNNKNSNNLFNSMNENTNKIKYNHSNSKRETSVKIKSLNYSNKPNDAIHKYNIIDKNKYNANRFLIYDASHNNLKESPTKVIEYGKKFTIHSLIFK